MSKLLKHVAFSMTSLCTFSISFSALAQSSPLSVSQVDPAQAREIASAQPAPSVRSTPNQIDAASALAEILERFAAGDAVDAGLVASANALSRADAEDSNVAVIQQEGDNNQAAIDQKGRNNDATIVQKGDQNASTIDQTGDNNVAEHVQIGNGLALEVTQNGDATVFITQGPQ
jgi:Curlin associated repeat